MIPMTDRFKNRLLRRDIVKILLYVEFIVLHDIRKTHHWM